MEEEKGRNNKSIFPAAILFMALISHVVPAEAEVREKRAELIIVYVSTLLIMNLQLLQ